MVPYIAHFSSRWPLPPCAGNSQSPLPENVPDIVLHALSAYCEGGLGNSVIYTDLARALKDWEAS